MNNFRCYHLGALNAQNVRRHYLNFECNSILSGLVYSPKLIKNGRSPKWLRKGEDPSIKKALNLLISRRTFNAPIKTKKQHFTYSKTPLTAGVTFRRVWALNETALNESTLKYITIGRIDVNFAASSRPRKSRER